MVGPIVSAILGMARVDLVLGYSLFFVLGHLLHQGFLERVGTAVLAIALSASIAVTAVGTALMTARTGTPDTTFYGYLTPNVVVASACVFLLVKRWFSRRPGSGPGRVVSAIGDASFGVYLVHPFFQSALLSVGFTTTVLPEIISVPLFAATLFVPSMIVAALLHRIPRVGRFLA